MIMLSGDSRYKSNNSISEKYEISTQVAANFLIDFTVPNSVGHVHIQIPKNKKFLSLLYFGKNI